MKMYELTIYRDSNDDIVIAQENPESPGGPDIVVISEDQVELVISSLKQEAQKVEGSV